jgi:hypothetical protein
MKPDWKDAPEWAKWLAMDNDGKWFFYECKPHTTSDVNSWQIISGNIVVARCPGWKDSLEARPDDAGNGKE